MRAEPGRPARLRIRALPPVGAILLAFAALLVLPLPAQAEDRSFVSNTVGQSTVSRCHGKSVPTDISRNFRRRQFTTGDNERRLYALDNSKSTCRVISGRIRDGVQR